MRKIILTFLITFVVLSTYGQEKRTETSHNGKYCADSHYDDQESKFIKIFEDGQLIDRINTKELQGEDELPIIFMFFTIDDKILYFHGGKSSYKYDMVTKEISQVFKGKAVVPLGLDKNDTNTIICEKYKVSSSGRWSRGYFIGNESTKELHKWKGDTYRRYIDGHLYPLKKNEIFVHDLNKREFSIEKL